MRLVLTPRLPVRNRPRGVADVLSGEAGLAERKTEPIAVVVRWKFEPGMIVRTLSQSGRLGVVADRSRTIGGQEIYNVRWIFEQRDSYLSGEALAPA